MSRKTSKSFHKFPRHTCRLELILEFCEPVATGRASEVARRLLESLQIAAPEVSASPELRKCSLTCHEMRQTVSLVPAAAARG